MPTPAQLASARDDWKAAPRTEKVAVLARWAAALGISVSTLYRQFNVLGDRGPARPREDTRPEYRDYARVVMQQMAKSPEGTIPVHLALDSCFKPNPDTGEVLLPPSAAQMPLATLQRILTDELGARQRKRRTRRLHADHANQAWLIDASTSKYLTVEQELPDGDYVLRLWRNPFPASGYKNKPLGPDRARLIYYGVWEMLTGYKSARPTVARGETGLDAMESLVYFFTQRTDPRDPLHGLPDDLWSDQGPLLKYGATADLLDRLGVNVPPCAPYQKERMGGVEQVWARLWQSFEQSIFLHAPATGRYELKLSQLTARLGEYLARENARTSRSDPTLTRAAHWVRSINQQGGARLCPANPIETLAREKRCKVDQSGIIRWDNTEYEVPKLHSCWVIARRALDGSGRVVVEDERTGERYDVTPYQGLKYNEWKGSQPALPIDKARAAAAALPLPGDVYAPAPADAAPANVVTGRFGPRQQPARGLPDPLEADRYASLSAAMAEFFQVFGAPLSAENRAVVEQRLLRDGLRKDAVRELALILSTATRTTGAAS
ncbi:hypothetical protein [uncultured Thiodictyon sp.]|uniref:hypothetical protein n=1 Tax=uncultured Thiodictyon sp. TaxID=1846217 RepID=UPI0025E5CB61|nr:hypothetical protein [uncultured Thiodictyon sp.]